MATTKKTVETKVEETTEKVVPEVKADEVIVEEKPSKIKEKAHAAKAWVSARKKQVATGVGIAVAVVGAGVAAAVINAKASESGDPTIGERVSEALEDVDIPFDAEA